MATKRSPTQEIAALKAENRQLKASLRKLESVKSTPRSSSRWRTWLIVLCVSMAGAMLVVGNILFWTGRTLTETDRYTEVVAPLIEEPVIQQAIAQKATDSLFEQVDVEAVLQTNLPSRIQFLAPTLSDQIQNFTNQQALKLVSSDEFKTVWVNFNTQMHQRVINFIRNYEGDGTISLADLYTAVSARLSDTRLSFLANKQLPAKVGQVTLISAPNLPKAHWIVVNLWWVRLLTIALFVGLSALAIWLAQNRRRALINLGLLYSGLLLILLISVRVGREVVTGRFASQYQAAAGVAWQTIMRPFIVQTAALILVALIIVTAAWLSGGGRSAQAVRRRLTWALSGKIHQAIFQKENHLSLATARLRTWIEGAIILVAGSSLLVVRLTPPNILVVLVATLLAVGIVEVLAAPRK